MAQLIINFACTERSKSGDLKSARATLGSKARTYNNFVSNINCWGKDGVKIGNGDKAAPSHSPPLRDAAQALLRVGASEWIVALVFQIWKFATSASQIKNEMSFATMAKKAILHFIDLLKPFSIENKNNSKGEKRLHFHSRFYSWTLQMFLGQR